LDWLAKLSIFSDSNAKYAIKAKDHKHIKAMFSVERERERERESETVYSPK